MTLTERAAQHAALGDERRLTIVDRLTGGDLTVADLGKAVAMPGNLLAHHLSVLEDAGLIERRVSEGDHRRRYVSLRRDRMPFHIGTDQIPPRRIAFVCTRNSARSQFAAALWHQMTGLAASSAGSDPADHVHPGAVRAAAGFGLDLSEAKPTGYESLPGRVDLVISVCDRAHETGVPGTQPRLHWSIPDPVPIGTPAAFSSAFKEIEQRLANFAAHLITN